MWFKKYLNLSKAEIFLLIILFLFVVFLVFGIYVDKNSVSILFIKIPLQVKDSVSRVFWKNFHSVFVTFAFFSYLILAVEEKGKDLSRPFLFLLFVYFVFSVVFGFKFGFLFFGKSFVSLFFLLFTLYSFLFFFEVVLNSRAIGALFVALINAFSGLMIYLHNFREIFLTGFYSNIIEAKYYSLPIYQKYTINFDFKNLITPVILLIATSVYKFIVKRGATNE